MHKILEPKVRIVTTKAMVIKVMVVAMVGVMSRPVVGPMPWISMSN